MIESLTHGLNPLCHLRNRVEIGDSITRGQVMAFVGSTGRSTGPHLHYELRLNDRPINPRRFLPPEATELKKVG